MSEKRKLIFLGDQNYPVKKALPQALEELGYEVRAFNDGQQVLEALDKAVADHDTAIVIADSYLQGSMSGEILVRKIREKVWAVPTLLWSNSGDKDAIANLVRIGNPDHAMKRVDAADTAGLERAIAATLEAFQASQCTGKGPMDHVAPRTDSWTAGR